MNLHEGIVNFGITLAIFAGIGGALFILGSIVLYFCK